MLAERRERRLGALTRRLELARRVAERLPQRVRDDGDLIAAFGCGIPFRGQLQPRARRAGTGAQRVLRVDLAARGSPESAGRRARHPPGRDRPRARPRGRRRSPRTTAARARPRGRSPPHARARRRAASGSAGRIMPGFRDDDVDHARPRQSRAASATAKALARSSTSTPSASGPSTAAMAASNPDCHLHRVADEAPHAIASLRDQSRRRRSSHPAPC